MIDTSYISGLSSINFEKIAQERVFESLKETKLDSAANLKREYFSLKNKIGRIPNLVDFVAYNSVDLEIIASYKKNYHSFLLQYDKDYQQKYGEEEVKVFNMLTREFLNGKRIHELIILQKFLEGEKVNIKSFLNWLKQENIYYDEYTLESIIKHLDMSYYIETTQKNYPQSLIEVDNDTIQASDYFKKMLENTDFKFAINDLLETAFIKNKDYDNDKQFTIGKIYTRHDVSRLLNWDTDRTGTIFGYTIYRGSCPFFNTYKKVNVHASINYADEFIDSSTFRQYSKNKRNLESQDVQDILNAQEKGIKLHLFVKKDDATYDTNFYYFGEMTPYKQSARLESMRNGDSVVRINMKLDTPVDEKMLNYLES